MTLSDVAGISGMVGVMRGESLGDVATLAGALWADLWSPCSTAWDMPVECLLLSPGLSVGVYAGAQTDSSSLAFAQMSRYA